MSILFETTQLNGMTVANRFVRSATWEAMADERGACTPRLVELVAQLAAGGVGLIISSHAFVSPEGQAGPRQLGIYDDALVPGLAEMTRSVHAQGGKIVAQLAHAGIFANPKLTGRPNRAVSATEGLPTSPGDELSVEEIAGLVEAFGRGAQRAREAGFDGVQLHSAHGYLLNQFLSPRFNRRTDAYGGHIQNRARVHREIVGRVRDAVGADFPVLVKLNSQDFLEGGLSLEDSLQAGEMMAEAGLDAIELSGGTFLSGELIPSRAAIRRQDQEAYFREEARAFKARLGIPIILVGGIRSFELAEQLVRGGVADYLSMSRPFIREPALVNRWRQGDLRPAACLSDNLCFGPARAGEGIFCVVARRGEGGAS